MRRDEIEAKVRAAFALVLGRQPTPGEDVTRDGEPTWDSLKHVELLFSVEDALAIRFDEAEMAGLASLSAIVASVERHLAS